MLQSPELSGCIFTLQKEVSNFEFRGRLVGRTYSAEDESNRRPADEPNQVVDKMLLVNLHSRLKFAQMRVRSWEKRWENHVKMACRLEV